MHAFLIVGKSKQGRENEIENIFSSRSIEDSALNRFILSPSQLVERETYGIKDVQRLIVWMQEHHGEPSAAIIEEAERLTEPAQHALLKTLEEGAPNVSMLLSAAGERSLLPTIRSRCRIIRIAEPSLLSAEEAEKIMNWLATASSRAPAKRILLLYQALSKIAGKTISPHIGSIARTNAEQFIERILMALHVIAKNFPDGTNLLWIAGILKIATGAHRRLRQNQSVALVIQQFMLDIPAADLPGHEAPTTLRSGYLLYALRRERNPSETKHASL